MDGRPTFTKAYVGRRRRRSPSNAFGEWAKTAAKIKSLRME
jgi:hypothetical protein